MASKLRPLYDRLYIRGECLFNTVKYRRLGKKNAKTMPPNPRVETDYDSVIRPYWQQFRVAVPKKFWFRLLCNEANEFSPKYIPDDLWFRDIIPYYNNLIFAKALQDKCLHNLFFPDMKRPETVVKRMAGVFYDDGLNLITEAEAVARCRGVGRVVVKPSVDSGQGNGIRFFDTDAITDEEIRAVFRDYGNNFIMQKKMAQHPALAALNPKSLNTVRVITFLHDDQVHILTSLLRVGGGDNEVDNTSQGGYKCTIGPDGRLHELGLSKIGGYWKYMPAYPNGIKFRDVVIPAYDRILETVSAHAAGMSHFRIIGWDIAVDPEGEPVLIEYNVIPAQGQGTDGPLFGELTDEVLTEVYGKRTGR